MQNLQVRPYQTQDSKRSKKWKTIDYTLLANLPDAKDAVPSPADVKRVPGLSDLAKHFIDMDDSWKTMLLLGRDCMWAIAQEDYTFDPNEDRHGYPIAIKSCLGWSIIGPIQIQREIEAHQKDYPDQHPPSSEQKIKLHDLNPTETGTESSETSCYATIISLPISNKDKNYWRQKCPNNSGEYGQIMANYYKSSEISKTWIPMSNDYNYLGHHLVCQSFHSEVTIPARKSRKKKKKPPKQIEGQDWDYNQPWYPKPEPDDFGEYLSMYSHFTC